jgi:uncharacterized protein YggL (DUF469 family)
VAVDYRLVWRPERIRRRQHRKIVLASFDGLPFSMKEL